MTYNESDFIKDYKYLKKNKPTIKEFFWESGDIKNFFFCWLDKCNSCKWNVEDEKLLFWLTKMPKYRIQNLFFKK